MHIRGRAYPRHRMGIVPLITAAASAYAASKTQKTAGSASGSGGTLPQMPAGTSGPTTISPTFQQSFTPQISPVFQQVQDSPNTTLEASPMQTATGGQQATGGGAPIPGSGPTYPSMPRAPSLVPKYPSLMEPIEQPGILQQMGTDWAMPLMIVGLGVGLYFVAQNRAA